MAEFTETHKERLEVLAGTRGVEGNRAVLLKELSQATETLETTAKNALAAIKDAAAAKVTAAAVDDQVNGVGGLSQSVAEALATIDQAVINVQQAISDAEAISNEVDVATASAIAAAGQAVTDAEGARDIAIAKAQDALDSEGAVETARLEVADNAGIATSKAAAAALSETNAGGSAILAATSRDVTARLATNLLPSDFREDSLFWTQNVNGDPATKGDVATPVAFRTVAGVGRVAWAPCSLPASRYVAQKGVVPYVAGRTLRVSATIRHVGPLISGNSFVLQFRKFDENYGFISASSKGVTPSVADTWETFTHDWALSGVDAAFVGTTCAFALVYDNPNAELEIRSILIEDVTDSVAAKSSAEASAQSLSLANVVKNGIDIVAQAVESDRLAAETASGAADGARSLAVTAKESAEGSASDALDTLDLVVSAKNAAGESANAANQSASLATSEANAAGLSAIAANNSFLAAEDEKDAAFIIKEDVVELKNNAAGSATTATSQATIAVNAVADNKVLLGNFNFEQDKAGWTSSTNAGSVTSPLGEIVTSGQTGGKALRTTGSTALYYNTAPIPIAQEKSYIVRARVKWVSGVAPLTFIGLSTYDANKATIGANFGRVYNVLGNTPLSNQGGYVVYESTPFLGSSLTVGTRYVAPLVLTNWGQVGNVTDIDECGLIDVTDYEDLTAQVETTASAISDINGKLSATYSIKVGAGGAASLLELVASDDPTGPTRSFAKLSADDILLDGSVAANKLLVGLGGNLIEDSGFVNGLNATSTTGSGGVLSQTTLSLRAPGNYAGVNYPTLQMFQNGTATDGYIDLYFVKPSQNRTKDSKAFPVRAGEYYGFSVYINAHRCDHRVYIFWRDATGTFLNASGTSLNVGVVGNSTNPDEWARYYVNGQAPAGAVFGQAVVRRYGTKSRTNSYLWCHKPMVSETSQYATEPQVYDKGLITLIDGNGLYAKSITAASGVIGDLAVNTLQIAGEAVTAGQTSFMPGLLPVTTSGTALNPVTLNTVSGYQVELDATICLSAFPSTATVEHYEYTVQFKRGSDTVQSYVFTLSSIAGRAHYPRPITICTADDFSYFNGAANYPPNALTYNVVITRPSGSPDISISSGTLKARQFKGK